jgi:Xaa-Pro aminopeptidase
MMRSAQTRISRLRQLMKSGNIEALLVTRREDVRYLSGFTGSAGSLLVGVGKPCLITDFRYKLQATKETSGIEIVIQKKDFFSALRDTSFDHGIKTLWFEESAITVEELKKLRKLGLNVHGHREMLRHLRMRKDREELISLRKAIRRAESSFLELMRYIKPGVTERELGLTLEFLMREKGARKAAFDTIVASGENGAMPHASVSNRRLRKGDLVTIDFGAEADGYYCDITRTLSVSKPTARQKEIHQLVLQAQEAAVQSIHPGISCKAVDAVAREIISRAGHGAHFGHGTGHGIGLMVHEGPSVSPLSTDQVEQDTVFTVEPGVYIPGWGGVRIEDMILVTEQSKKVLTSLPRELEILKKL